MTQIDSESALNGARILVVEDDFLISMELDTILADAGAKVVGPCRTIAQAKRLIEANSISGAVLDFRLGADTSLSIAHELRRHDIPFVFFTAQANTRQIQSECPGATVVAKPFHRRTILAAVADMFH
ncbi:MAG: response regulator [Xanthobacteraceae bacterium]